MMEEKNEGFGGDEKKKSEDGNLDKTENTILDNESQAENLKTSVSEEDNKIEISESGQNEIPGDLRDTENKNDEEKVEENKKVEEIQNNQLKWAIYLMIAVILIIVVVPYVKVNFLNSFNYGGLKFQKTSLGDLVFYSTKFPVVKVTGQIIGEYAVNFRSDPRDLDFIEVDVLNDKIEFVEIAGGGYTPTYISLDPYMKVCSDSSIALLNLAGFLRDSGLEIRSAITNDVIAAQEGKKYMVCDTAKSDTVIMIKSGESDSIKEVDKNCYELIYSECNILPVTERFMLVILEEYVGKFDKDKKDVREVIINRGDVERRYQNGTVETIINIATFPNHDVIIKTIDPTPEEGRSNVFEYFERDSGFEGKISISSFPADDVFDIVIFVEDDGKRVEINGNTLHKFEGLRTGEVVDIELIGEVID